MLGAENLSTAAEECGQVLSDALADWLYRAGVRLVLGVSGGGVVYQWGALCSHPGLRVVHTQQESGAAFAATEASLASGRPVVVFVTTGPGLTNAMTGLMAARQEGARVIVLSGMSPARSRHRLAVQESHANALPAGLVGTGPVFDVGAIVETAEMLPPLLQRIALGLARDGGFVAHLGLPTDVQSMSLSQPLPLPRACRLDEQVNSQLLSELAEELIGQRVVLMVGFEARESGADIAALAERLGATIVATPRGKGIVPEDHPHYAGVCGLGGHEETDRVLAPGALDVVLALGTDLGEPSSQWSSALEAAGRVVQVHPRPERLGGPLPLANLVVVEIAVGGFVRALLDQVPDSLLASPMLSALPSRLPPRSVREGRVAPQAVIESVQKIAIDTHGARLIAEVGNAFAWAIHLLRLKKPDLRVSVRWGSMGHASSGVVGLALGSEDRPVLALCGDGAMLMMNELATAVKHQLRAIWLVLNDSSYGMCRHGAGALGVGGVDCDLPEVDFAMMARSFGAFGVRVHDAELLDEALELALSSKGPVVVDVLIDPDQRAPIGRRIQKLTWHDQDS